MTARAMVMRMDIIPETEQFHIVKVGLFGLPYSTLVDIKKLERIHFEKDETYPMRWYKSIIWIPKEEREMVYRNPETEEIFTFSPRGDWSKTGLEHKLLH